MKDYTDFLNAPDEPAVKDNSEFLNAPDTYTETKGNKFRQVKPVEPSSIAKLFLKYAPDWMQETATRSATGGYLPEVLDVAGGATGVARGGLNMVSPGMGERAFPTKGFTTGTDVDPTSGGYLVGQFIDPFAQALGMGAGRVVQAVPAVSKAYKSAEAIRAANATRTAGTAAKNVPMNVEQAIRYGASGAGAGAGTGYLSSEGDLTAASEGGLLGFGLGTGLYGLGKGLQLGAGHLGDFITGKSGKVNAGKIFRKAEELTPGSNLRTQLANAGPDLTAAQAAYGVNNNPWQALGVAAAENDKTSFYTALKAKQAAAREGMLSGATPDLATAEANRTGFMASDMANARDAANLARIARETPFMPQVYQWVDSLGMLQQGVDPPANAKGLRPAPGTQITVKPGETRQYGSNAPSRTTVTPEVDALGNPLQPKIIGTDSAGMPIYSTPGTRTSTVPATSQRVSTIPEVKATVGAQPGTAESSVRLIRQPGELPGIPAIGPLKANPVFQALMADARRMAAARTGLPSHLMRLTEDQLADIKADPTKSLEGLQMMKAALDAKFSKTPLKDSALDAFDEEAITKLKKAMLGAVDAAIPEYGAARANYAANSAPVNQAKVLEVLRQKLVNLTNPAEQRTGPFLAALDRGEESALRAAGLNTRFNDNLQSVLTPQQFQTVGDIASELTRDAAMKSQAAAGAKPLAGIVGDTLAKNMTLPGYIDPKVTAYNKFISFMTGKVAQKTVDAISEGMKSGKSALEVLNTLPLAERNRGLMALGQLGKISPELAGIAGGMQSNKNGNQ